MEKSTKPYELPLTITTSIETYIVFSIIFVGITLAVLIISIWKIDVQGFIISSIFGLISFFIIIWLNSHKIVLKKEGLEYRTLLSRNEALYSNITQINIEIGRNPNVFRAKGFIRLLISDKNKDENLVINLAPFGEKTFPIIADALITNTHAKADDLTRNLQKGDLNPILYIWLKEILKVTIPFFILLAIITGIRRIYGIF